MHSSTECFLLNPEAVNLDNPALFWAREPDQAFVQAIENLGQLEPVLVTSKNGQAELLAGYKRCLALGRLGRKVMALEKNAPDPFFKGMIYLLSNSGKTPDQAEFISALRYFHGLNRLEPEVYTQLGLEPGSRVWKQWLSWLDLPVKWDQCLARGSICLESASILQWFCPEDRQALLPFFENLSWSRNNCLKFLNLVRENVTMKKMSVSELFQQVQLYAVLDSPLSPKDKISSVISTLTRSAYPFFAAMKTRLERRLQHIASGTAWKLSHTDSFENTRINFSISVSNPEALNRALDDLQKIAESGKWKPWPVNPHEH